MQAISGSRLLQTKISLSRIREMSFAVFADLMEYASTGVMPSHRHRPDGGYGKKHSGEKTEYMALDTEDRIEWNIRELADAVSNAEVYELTEDLREEDRAVLLMLLEKVKFGYKRRCSWAKRPWSFR